MKTVAVAAVAAAGLALLISSAALAKTPDQCEAQCAGSSNRAQCVEDCILSSKPTYKVAPTPKGIGHIDKKRFERMCPSGWMWSPAKGRCINLFGGAHL
jgi:hypothetical protein